MKKLIALLLIIVVVLFGMSAGLSGCSIIKEGITGERPAGEGDGGSADGDIPSLPPAFPIIGDWFGVYGGNEYVSLRFTADGKCELQPAVYPSDMFGPRYYGDYRWTADDGNQIVMDMYKGVSKEVDYGNGNIWDEWSDGGRNKATTALSMTFEVYGGKMKSLALRAVMAGIDTEGYTVVQTGAFLVILAEGAGGSGNSSPFIFGSISNDQTEGKSKTISAPNALMASAQRFYTTAELNVRCGPSTDYATYGTVPIGTPVDKIGVQEGKNDWAFVLLADGGGWCNTEYLTETAPAVPVQPAAPAAPTVPAGQDGQDGDGDGDGDGDDE